MTVDGDAAGQRIDNFLRKLLNDVPHGHIYRIIRTGQVRVNGKRIKPTYKLVELDDLRLPPLLRSAAGERQAPDALCQRLESAVIHEDDELLVLNKPAGIAVHQGSDVPFGVIETLRQTRQSSRLELIHRLDKETSGCLLVGKTLKATRLYQEMFKERGVQKHYRALLSGRWDAQRERVALRLSKQRGNSGEERVISDRNGQTAESFFSTLRQFSAVTEVDVEITTGRTHQIRAHAAQSRHAVVGDRKYGNRIENAEFRRMGLNRLYLHAERLRLPDGKHFEQSPDKQWQADLDSLTRVTSRGQGPEVT